MFLGQWTEQYVARSSLVDVNLAPQTDMKVHSTSAVTLSFSDKIWNFRETNKSENKSFFFTNNNNLLITNIAAEAELRGFTNIKMWQTT